MKLLLFSDIHVHNFKQFASYDENGINSRLKEGLDTLDWVIETAKDSGIQNVLFGGDFFHQRGVVVPSVFNRVKSKMVESELSWTLNTGNHDQENNGTDGDSSVVSLTDDLSIGSIEGISDARIKCIKAYGSELYILFIPYHKHIDDFKELLKAFESRLMMNHINAVVMHQGITKGKPRDKESINADDLIQLIGEDKLIFNGHYHEPFKYKNIYNMGSCMSHNFNDIGKKSYIYILDTETGKVKKVENKHSPRFVEYDGENDSEIKGNYVRFSEGETDVMKKKLLDMGAKCVIPYASKKVKKESKSDMENVKGYSIQEAFEVRVKKDYPEDEQSMLDAYKELKDV